MLPILSCDQARAFDAWAECHVGLSGPVLMENAGLRAAQWLLSFLRCHDRVRGPAPSVLVLCGPGNNGGDGWVVARQLLSQGVAVRCLSYVPSGRSSSDAELNRKAYRALGGAEQPLDVESLSRALEGVSCVVDGLLGTGLSRPLPDLLQDCVRYLQKGAVPVIALDVPSGLHGDTGKVDGVAVRAHTTLCFGHVKRGLLSTLAATHTGHLEVLSLGAPSAAGPGESPVGYWLTAEDVGEWIARRQATAHKSSAGRVAVIAGSRRMPGAALLTARGALRAGAGLVTLCTEAAAAPLVAGKLPEVMLCPLGEESPERDLAGTLSKVHAAVVGPGLGSDAWAHRVARHVVLEAEVPVVVDADALSSLGTELGSLREAPAPRLLTPHAAELGRLLGLSAEEVEADRFGCAQRAAQASGHTVLLKGPHTLVAKEGQPLWVTSTGVAALATGGTGDVLSGVCAAWAVHLPLDRAAALGALVHGLAARHWSDAHAGADRGLLASEVADGLPRALASFQREEVSLPV